MNQASRQFIAALSRKARGSFHQAVKAGKNRRVRAHKQQPRRPRGLAYTNPVKSKGTFHPSKRDTGVRYNTSSENRKFRKPLSAVQMAPAQKKALQAKCGKALDARRARKRV